MPLYNHAFDIAFAIPHSEDPNGEEITADQMRRAIIDRALKLDDDELLEAVGSPFDSFEEE